MTLQAQVLELRRRIIGLEHPDTLRAMGKLAMMCWNQGKISESEALYLEMFELQKKNLGQDHPATIDTMRYLAAKYSKQGRH